MLMLKLRVYHTHYPLSALQDSGCELCCVRADVVAPLGWPKLGHVVLHGVGADPLSADVVKMNVKLMNGRNGVPITAAVCEKMTGELLLGSDVVNRLHDQLLREQFENEYDKEPVVTCACVNEAVTVVNDDNSNDAGEIDQANEDEHKDIVNQDVNEVVGVDDIQKDDNDDDVENTRKASTDVLKLNNKMISHCLIVGLLHTEARLAISYEIVFCIVMNAFLILSMNSCVCQDHAETKPLNWLTKLLKATFQLKRLRLVLNCHSLGLPLQWMFVNSKGAVLVSMCLGDLSNLGCMSVLLRL